ncbi:MAG: hypothetical protein EZS28_040595 [Streblomastix strix]|uniref:Uncharacterized protein n=1 Tax=Streblomastix strix TaxID=222440 RepID=A0A5J4U0J9_9EUKA|nr:MAG: hypothetical protein EZS28_040595 [Streblomastix strix]
MEISSFCPKDAFISDSIDKDGEMEFGFYDWTLNNGTHIDFIADQYGDEPWVVDGKSIIMELSEEEEEIKQVKEKDGDLFTWTAINMGLSKGANLCIFATLLLSSLFSSLL